MNPTAPTPASETEPTFRTDVNRPAASTVPPHRPAGPTSPDTIDGELVDQTRAEIQELIAEIAELARTQREQSEFFAGLLTRATRALASQGGAVWLLDNETRRLQPVHQIQIDQTCLVSDQAAAGRHQRLLEKLCGAGEPALVPPHSGAPGENEPGNPTDHLLIVGPLKVNRQTVGLIEILQRTGAGPTTQRGYLRFLTRICGLASEYLTEQQIACLGQQQALWQQLNAFVRDIHRGLHPEQTAYLIANEGRRIIDCDRVSVVQLRSGRCHIRAVSGLDSIERRADQIKKLQKLTAAVVRTGHPFWYRGQDQELAPQIEKKLHDYVDQSHSRALGIVPLNQPPEVSGNDDDRPGPVIGALIVEQMRNADLEDSMRQRVDFVAQHAQNALANAIEHHSLFLMPLWKALGRVTAPFTGTRLPRTLLATVILVGIVAFFAWTPYPFTLSAKGTLTPRRQSEVFAQVNGILDEVLVSEDGDAVVREGEILARMSNNDLQLQIQNLEGRINQTHEQIRKFKRALMSERLERMDGIMLDGELARSEEALRSLQRELAIKQQRAADLIVRSPATGFVANWKVRQHLVKRPVDRGQNLMTIVDPQGGWQLDLEIPERRLGHLLRRMASSDEKISVTFALVSLPGQEFSGVLTKLDQKLEVYGDDGNCARATAQFDNATIPRDLLKSGTRIHAKLHCGERSIGFVWFHELFETIDSAVRYWF